MNELKILSRLLREWHEKSGEDAPTAVQLSQMINTAINISRQEDNIQYPVKIRQKTIANYDDNMCPICRNLYISGICQK